MPCTAKASLLSYVAKGGLNNAVIGLYTGLYRGIAERCPGPNTGPTAVYCPLKQFGPSPLAQ
jgi:hypothetical protein